MSIESLDPRNELDVDAVAQLHETFLPDSPIALLGPGFVRKFYYSTLVNDGLVDCMLCRADGRIVAFISYTTRPADFMSQGIRNHFFHLSWLMLKVLVTEPRRLKVILSTLQMIRERDPANQVQEPSPHAEVLSMTTLPAYQNYVPPGGKSRVTLELFEHAMQYLRGRGCREVIFLVQPSNVASNIFFNAIGCRFDKVNHAGKPVHRYIYRLGASVQ